jgi:signal transduction histidine kinase
MPFRKPIRGVTKVLGGLTIGGVICFSAWSLYQWSHMHGWIAHTQKVTGVYNECLSTVLELDVARRNYVFTADDQSMAQYRVARADLDRTLEELLLLTRDNPSQQARLAELRKKVSDLVAVEDQIMAIRKQKGFDAILPLLRQTNNYANLRNAIQLIILKGVEEEAHLLTSRTNDGLVWERVSAFAVAMLSLVSLFSTMFVFKMMDREAQARELESERLLAQHRDDFMGALAHSLKIPLIGARRIFELVTEQNAQLSPERQKTLFQALRVSNEEQLLLIDRLIELYTYEGSGQEAERVETNLSQLVRDCLVKFEDRAEAVGISLKAETADLSLPCDQAAITCLLNNFIDNAIKHTSSGGEIVVRLKKEKNEVVIEVQDTGCGFDVAAKEMMFEKLWQGPAGKEYAPVIGLGLYLCKQIATAHSGTISCESEIGKGSTFSVSLPIPSSRPAV